MKIATFATILGLSTAFPCVYNDGRYTLNLTQESEWTLELETPDWFYYYTPCRNGLQCHQGNANFYANAAQYKQGANQCVHYLSVDHHDQPTYEFYGAAWRFEYEDGETCSSTQQPRRTVIYYHCNEEMNTPTYLYAIGEPNPCTYVLDIRGNAACVNQSSHNSNCQWRTPSPTAGEYFYLDLSALNNETIYARMSNGYYHTVTPCRNDLHCWQQYPYPVMGAIENHETGTCEHYGAIWEDGRVQPVLHAQGTEQEHWSFHYFNGQHCSNGSPGEEELRFYCDPTADPFKVINSTNPRPCEWDINIATKYACTTNSTKAQRYYKELRNMKRVENHLTQELEGYGKKLLARLHKN